VKALSPDADVYASTSPDSALDEVARMPALAQAIRSLRAAGYDEVALAVISAGGVIARYFVEDVLNSGVTKVCKSAPRMPDRKTVLCRASARCSAFCSFIGRRSSQRGAKTRGRQTIPPQVEFVCIVAAMNWIGDGVVHRDAQGRRDLQAKGCRPILFMPHVGAMYSSQMANRIAELVKTPQPRWSHERGRSRPGPKSWVDLGILKAACAG